MVQAPVHSNSPQCRPRRNAIVDHDRRAVFDFRAIASSNMTFAAPLDLGKFGIANGVEVGFLDAGATDDIFIAHDKRRVTVDNCPIANSGSNGTPILRTKIKSSGALSAEATSTATGTPPRGSARITGSWSR
jgi:hypothetical protein